MKKNGFTLIELLAVIVILGIILLIAVPSISKAILNSRKKAYISTASQIIDGAKMSAMTNPELLPTVDSPNYIKITDIKLEKGSNTKSPFGKAYSSTSYVKVEYSSGTKQYLYSICLVDVSGNGISKTNGDGVEATALNDTNVQTGTAKCLKVVEGTVSEWNVSSYSAGGGVTGYSLNQFNTPIDLENSSNVVVLKDYYNDSNIDPDYLTAFGLISTSQMTNRDAYIVYIPNDIDGTKITSIGPELFIPYNKNVSDVFDTANPIEEYMRIKEIRIPDGIKEIWSYGLNSKCGNMSMCGPFTNNFNLMSVSLPSTLTYIADSSFARTNIRSLTIPKAVTFVGGFAFRYANIDSVTFEGADDNTSNLWTIEGYAFEGNNLSTIIIPASVQRVMSYAFNKIYSSVPWSSITFAGTDDNTSKLTKIEKYAFYSYPYYNGEDYPEVNITIPSLVTNIGTYAFYGNNITNITVKRASSSGMTLGTFWNGNATVTWSSN